jgi:hypothetical protein
MPRLGLSKSLTRSAGYVRCLMKNAAGWAVVLEVANGEADQHGDTCGTDRHEHRNLDHRPPAADDPPPAHAEGYGGQGTTEGASAIATRTDPAMVMALAATFRLQRMLNDGHYTSIREIAAAKKIDRSYIGSILRLSLLAPDIIEAILDGRQSARPGLPTLLKPFPCDWGRQRDGFLT